MQLNLLKYIILSLYFFRDNSSLIKTLYAGLLKQNELHGISPYVIPACNDELPFDMERKQNDNKQSTGS